MLDLESTGTLYCLTALIRPEKVKTTFGIYTAMTTYLKT